MNDLNHRPPPLRADPKLQRSGPAAQNPGENYTQQMVPTSRTFFRDGTFGIKNRVGANRQKRVRCPATTYDDARKRPFPKFKTMATTDGTDITDSQTSASICD